MRTILLIVPVTLAVAAGCDWFENPVESNLPPDTEILDCAPTGARVGDDLWLDWNGHDPDGMIEGYEWSYDDGPWVRGEAGSILIEDVTLGRHVFKVRAIDEDGVADPTPAVCTFTVSADPEPVDRIVLVELFTTTWCRNCPNAEGALVQLLTQIGSDNLCVLAYHDTPERDGLATPESVGRIDWYTANPAFPGQTDVWPTVVFDGLRVVEGAGSVGQATADYGAEIAARRDAASPILLRIEGEVTGSGGHVRVGVHARGTLPDDKLVLRLVVTEDDVPYPGTFMDEFDFVVRDVLEEATLELGFVGDSTMVERSFEVDDSWINDNVDVIGFVQSQVTMEVIQSARLRGE